MKNDERDTPIRSPSGGYPLLQGIAKELILQLLAVPSDEATQARRRLLALVSILESWGLSNQPTFEEKKRLIDELSEAIRQAHEMIK
jgi:hypothetical protein